MKTVEARLLETPDPAEVLRMGIDRFVAQFGDRFPKMLVAKVLLAKAVDISLSQESAIVTIAMLRRAADLLGGRWGPATIKDFFATKNY